MKTPMAHRRDPRLADSRTGAEILRREHLGRSSMWRDLFIDLISRSPIARWAPIPLRLIVGYGFMEHGFAKLARGPDAFPAILHAIGVPAPHLMGWLTILVEIVGGLAVLLGALVPLASIPMAAVLLVAIIPVPYRSCSRWCPIRLARASSIAWRGRVAMRPASSFLNMT